MVRGDRAIFLTLLIFIILINSFVVFAAEDNASFGVDQRAISTIALLQNPPGNAEGFVEALRDSEDRVNFCWPNGGCKVKDTALATPALITIHQSPLHNQSYFN